MKRIKSKLEVLSEEELLRINDAALRILDEVGIHLPNEELLKMCRERGCAVDASGEIVRFPGKMKPVKPPEICAGLDAICADAWAEMKARKPQVSETYDFR